MSMINKTKSGAGKPLLVQFDIDLINTLYTHDDSGLPRSLREVARLAGYNYTNMYMWLRRNFEERRVFVKK